MAAAAAAAAAAGDDNRPAGRGGGGVNCWWWRLRGRRWEGGGAKAAVRGRRRAVAICARMGAVVASNECRWAELQLQPWKMRSCPGVRGGPREDLADWRAADGVWISPFAPSFTCGPSFFELGITQDDKYLFAWA